MKKTLLVAAFLLTASVAEAREYGKAGTIAIGGRVGFTQTTNDFEDSGKSESSTMTVGPEIGFYPADHLELIGSLEMTQSENDDTNETVTDLRAGAGAGFFLEAGTLHLGPVVLLTYGQEEREVGSSSETKTGPGASLSLQLRVPVSEGGLITAGIGYEYQMVDVDAGGASDSGTRGRVRSSLGFSVYF